MIESTSYLKSLFGNSQQTPPGTELYFHLLTAFFLYQLMNEAAAGITCLNKPYENGSF